METASQINFVLIDDDEIFCDIMANYAKLRDISLDYFLSLGEMGSIGRLSNYQVAIVDFDLGQMNGVEIAEYLPAFFGNKPLILVSATEEERLNITSWPGSIKAFVHKGKGPAVILDTALEIARKHQEENPPSRPPTNELTKTG